MTLKKTDTKSEALAKLIANKDDVRPSNPKGAVTKNMAEKKTAVKKAETPKVAAKKRATQKTTATIKNSDRSAFKLNDEMVSQYLMQHPDFFIRHAKQVENIQIPHPVRGVISLPEWQLARQRNQIKQLESEITLLMEHASANEKLFEALVNLQNELLLSHNLDDLVVRLNEWAKSLGLVGAYLYLFSDKWQLSLPSNYCHLAIDSSRFDFIRVRHLQYNYQYLGQLNPIELNLLIPQRVYVGSVALSLLGKFGDLGVLVFASRNPYHYQVGQGTLLLQKISEMIPILISRWVMRKRS